MSAREHDAPSRMNLLRTRRRLERVAKGISLLRRKREALVREFFRIARPAVDARAVIERESREAYERLLQALAARGGSELAVLGVPSREVTVEVRPGQVWGISVSDVVDRPRLGRTLPARGTSPGGTGPAAVEAAAAFEALTDLLIEAAPKEQLIRRLGEALAVTTRQVNTLEHRVAPALRRRAGALHRTLDEREREERLRLRRVIERHGAE